MSKIRITTTKESPTRVVTVAGQGPPGIPAYQHALNQGFVGTLDEWLDSLIGDSAYEVALDNGFVGTEKEWLDSLRLTARQEDADKILTNDGQNTYWTTLEQKLNNTDVLWDLGQIEQ